MACRLPRRWREMKPRLAANRKAASMFGVGINGAHRIMWAALLAQVWRKNDEPPRRPAVDAALLPTTLAHLLMPYRHALCGGRGRMNFCILRPPARRQRRSLRSLSALMPLALKQAC